MDIVDFIAGALLASGIIGWATYQPCPLWVAILIGAVLVILYVEVRSR